MLKKRYKFNLFAFFSFFKERIKLKLKKASFYPTNERMSCVTFQLKPVRSLDSLRPAWSGRLRHGPLPFSPNSTEIPPKPKFNPEPPQEISSNQYDLETSKKITPNVKLKQNSQISNNSNSKLVDTSPLIHISPNIKKNEETIREIINPSNPFVNSEMLNSKLNGKEFSSDDKERKVTDKLLTDPFDDDSVKSNLQDPFDTSRVLIPMNPVFHSTNNEKSINSHPSQPLNTELCSSHAKVNITTHFSFCFAKMSLSFLLY